MELSVLSNALISAYESGYRVIDGRVIKNRFLKGSTDKNGYQIFSFGFGGKKRNIFVHRLVAFQKYGMAMFKPGIEVRHLDGKPGNNLDGNIAIGTHSENLMDIPRELRIEKARIASRAYKKILEERRAAQIRLMA